MKTTLGVEDLGGLLDEPLLAVLGTVRADGSVLLSPVCHEWRDGAFNIWVGANNFKTRHLRRDPRASISVAESAVPFRGIYVRGTARFIEDDVTEIARRIMARYVGEAAGAAYAQTHQGTDLIVRVEPDDVRAWDVSDFDWAAAAAVGD